MPASNQNSNEEQTIKELDAYIEKQSSAFYDREISIKEILDQVNSHIKLKDVSAVLLCGSRATKRNNPLSDVDLLVIKNDPYNISESFRDKNGVRYHMNIREESYFNEDYAVCFLRFFYGMRPIYDPHGIGRSIVKKVLDYEIGLCSTIEKKNPERRTYLYKLLDLINDENTIIASFVKAKILREYPAFLASYNGFNLIGFKTTIDCLIRDNIKLAELDANALDKHSTKQDLTVLIDKSFDRLCGLDIFNLDFEHSPTAYDIAVGDSNMYCLYCDYDCFMNCLDHFRPDNASAANYYFECCINSPKLFEKLRSIID